MMAGKWQIWLTKWNFWPFEYLWHFREFNWAVIIARGCGMCLNFNGMFILVLMLRYCLTWIRSTWIGHYLPMDQSILLHKMVGLVIFGQSFVHTLAHLVNIREYALQSKKKLWKCNYGIGTEPWYSLGHFSSVVTSEHSVVYWGGNTQSSWAFMCIMTPYSCSLTPINGIRLLRRVSYSSTVDFVYKHYITPSWTEAVLFILC